MKKSDYLSHCSCILSFLVCFLFANNLFGQDTAGQSAPLPENINKIVSFSCMPCHSSTGGMLSRGKLNFNEWTTYSADKQKKKAKQMYKELNKDAMPPKSARENNPDIIPTREQIDMIKAWADSFE